MRSEESGEWYAQWFDTPFYHKLYAHRDYNEAQQFISNLDAHLGLQSGASVLDAACGKGRHSIQLLSLGYQVVGVDLSEQSIAFAKQHESKGLSFQQADMRALPFEKEYDAVFNLFTSFGYFEEEKDDLRTLSSFHKALKDDGLLVIDFLNVYYALERLVEKETVERAGIRFHLQRKLEQGFIEKHISFEADGEQFQFTERVKAIDKPQFERLLKETGFSILETLGDYELNSFEKAVSPRLILIAQKSR